MKRSQFTFYESFATALKRIRKKSDRCAAYDAIVDYALYGLEPDMEALPNPAAIALELIRPNLDASRKKAINGQLGGLAQAKGKQTGSKKESKKENKKEKEGEIEKENEKESFCVSIHPLPSFSRTRTAENAVENPGLFAEKADGRKAAGHD